MNRPTSALRSAPAGVDAPAVATPPEARLLHARLVMRDGHRYAALTDAGASWVSPAAGCLLQPELGDLVLLSLAAGQGYILTVLERATPQALARIEVPGDLSLSVPHGKLAVHAAEGVELDAGPQLSVTAQQASAAYTHAELACETLRQTGVTLQTQWHSRSDVSGTRMDIATRSEFHSAESVRRIAGHEDVNAGSLRQTVSEDWSVHAASADVKGRDRVAIDGGTVQLG